MSSTDKTSCSGHQLACLTALRAREEQLNAVGDLLELPSAPLNRFTQHNGQSLWRNEPETTLWETPNPPDEKIQKHLHNHQIFCVEVTATLFRFSLHGSAAMFVAQKHLSLDLSSMKDGDYSHSAMWLAHVAVARLEAEHFLIQCRTSFAPYVRALLKNAAEGRLSAQH